MEYSVIEIIFEWIVVPFTSWIIMIVVFKTCKNWYIDYNRNNSEDSISVGDGDCNNNNNISKPLVIQDVPQEPTIYKNTRFQVTSFGIDPEFENFLQKNASHVLLPIIGDTKDFIIYSLFQSDRLHLKVAHKEEHIWGSIFIYGSLCAFCHKKLYLYGFHVTQHYFCFDCIRTYIIPTFTYERFSYCYKIFTYYGIPDQLQLILNILTNICFDVPQIINFQFACIDESAKSKRKCMTFECDKCPLQAEFKPIEIYRYLLMHNKTNKQLLKKVEELEKGEESEKEKGDDLQE